MNILVSLRAATKAKWMLLIAAPILMFAFLSAQHFTHLAYGATTIEGALVSIQNEIEFIDELLLVAIADETSVVEREALSTAYTEFEVIKGEWATSEAVEQGLLLAQAATQLRSILFNSDDLSPTERDDLLIQLSEIDDALGSLYVTISGRIDDTLSDFLAVVDEEIGLSTSVGQQIEQSMERISRAVTSIQTPPAPTVEIRIVSNDFAQAQFIDDDGNLQVLDFYFSEDEVIADDLVNTRRIQRSVLQRINGLEAVEIDSLRLYENPVVVSTFSEESVLRATPVPITDTTPEVDPIMVLSDADVNSALEARRRTNLESALITGDVDAYNARIQLNFGPEPDPDDTSSTLPAETIVFAFNDLPDRTEMGRITTRMNELREQVLEETSLRTRLSRSAISEVATTTFRRFTSADRIGTVYNPADFNRNIIAAAGVYSQINSVSVVAGRRLFRLDIRTDQAELARLVVQSTPCTQESRGGGDNQRWVTVCPDTYQYDFEYFIHGERFLRERATDATRTGIRNRLRTSPDGDDFVPSIIEFASKFGVGENHYINQIESFMTQNEAVASYYNPDDLEDAQNIAPTCNVSRHEIVIREILKEAASSSGMQLFRPIEDMYTFTAPTRRRPRPVDTDTFIDTRVYCVRPGFSDFFLNFEI